MLGAILHNFLTFSTLFSSCAFFFIVFVDHFGVDFGSMLAPCSDHFSKFFRCYFLLNFVYVFYWGKICLIDFGIVS